LNLLRSGFGIEILVNIVFPWLIYVEAQPAIGRVHALMASMLPPIAWSLIRFAVKRRVDALSIIVVAGIALSLIAFIGGGSFRVLELREHLIMGVMGLVFLGSLAIKRPLLSVLVRSMAAGKSQADAEKLEKLLDNPRRLTFLTLVVGFLMLAQTVVAIILVFSLPVREFLIVSPVLNYVLIGIFAGVVLYTKHRRGVASAQAAQGQRERNL
jgi:hypothetical protein